jgi:prepilin-type N-terminal cleavage/methylation domain-containing protein
MKLTNPRSRLRTPSKPASQARGFSLLELMVSATVLLVVVGTAVNYIGLVTQRSKAEQTKVDLTQEGREFVDEFERDIHQAGFPGCADFDTGGTTACAVAGTAATATYNNANIAVGIVAISYTNIIFEGDVNGDGAVESVEYRLLDSAGNYPPTGTCPCTLQRSQVPKVNSGLLAPAAATAYPQLTSWSQELQNVVNSGSPAANAAYGGGLNISGNVLFGGGAITNTAYYAAVTTFKDFPVFSAYDQSGLLVQLPQDNSTFAGQQALKSIKTIRLTINLLASVPSADAKTGVRAVVTLVGDGRRNNMMPWETP